MSLVPKDHATWSRTRASQAPDNIFESMRCFLLLFVQPKRSTTGLVTPVKLNISAFAKLGAIGEVTKILKRHHIFKASFHLTAFNLIIIHITHSTFSSEGDALVPQDSAILFQLGSISFRAHGEPRNMRRKTTLLIQRKNSTGGQKMHSLCEWL